MAEVFSIGHGTTKIHAHMKTFTNQILVFVKIANDVDKNAEKTKPNAE